MKLIKIFDSQIVLIFVLRVKIMTRVILVIIMKVNTTLTIKALVL